jgi:hypothetical protein
MRKFYNKNGDFEFIVNHFTNHLRQQNIFASGDGTSINKKGFSVNAEQQCLHVPNFACIV